ncbi:hypothetical protein ACLOJK_037897 [Asimina triloba]
MVSKNAAARSQAARGVIQIRQQQPICSQWQKPKTATPVYSVEQSVSHTHPKLRDLHQFLLAWQTLSSPSPKTVVIHFLPDTTGYGSCNATEHQKHDVINSISKDDPSSA